MNQDRTFHSRIAEDLRHYIALKKALKRRFDSETFILLTLDRFLCNLGDPTADLTAETFSQWCATMPSVAANTRHSRMRVVRNFCLYRRRAHPECFVPERHPFPVAPPLSQPYQFSDADVARLLALSSSIPNSVRSPLRGASTRLAIVLLYTTGLRRGELLRLTAEDYDPAQQTLLIRCSKFHKSRLLPVPSDVAVEIEQFLQLHRAIQPPLPVDAPLLWTPYCGGQTYSSSQLRKNLGRLLRLAGIKKTNGRLPRIHDFRFSFIVNALVRWYREGLDVQARLPFLAAYVGHVSVLSTYYYLRFIEPLATLASTTFAARFGDLIAEAEGRAEDEN